MSCRTPFSSGLTPEERSSEAVYEARKHILDGHSPSGMLNKIPKSVRRAFHRPTAEQLQRAKEREKRNQRHVSAFTLNPKIVICIPIMALVAIWPTYSFTRKWCLPM